MEVNNEKFNTALHHPVYTANKIQRLLEEINTTLKAMLKVYAAVKGVEKDLSLYRQELLGSITEESEKK